MDHFKQLLEAKDLPIGTEQLGAYKKTFVRTEGRLTNPDANSAQKSFGGTVLAFLATKSNMAAGYIVSTLSAAEEKEFGKDALRVSSEKTWTTTIAKIDMKKGKIIFIDNEAYEAGDIKWQTPMAYDRLILDKTEYINKI